MNGEAVLVDWSKILPQEYEAKVIFSSLEFASTPRINSNVVGIEMPGGFFIDVEWVKKLGCYVVTLFFESIENVESEKKCGSALDVIGVVVHFAAHAFSIKELPRVLSDTEAASPTPDDCDDDSIASSAVPRYPVWEFPVREAEVRMVANA